jgi:LPXTG-site transpeptidase (sortase) family protein
LHNIITIIVDQDNAMVYYDHWENGYLNGAAGDETYTTNMGSVITFTSDLPVPRAAGDSCLSMVSIKMAESPKTTCYDGRDRIYIIGAASVVQAFWPNVTGTVYANAWEIYPVTSLESNYTIPVGENMAAAPTSYLDFDQSFILVQAVHDNTRVQIDDPTSAGVEVDTMLNRGEITQLFHSNEDTTVTSSHPVYVELMTGQYNTGISSESRSYTIIPRNLWESSYYSPVPGFVGGYDTDIFIFNPSGADLIINYQDRIGTGSFVVPTHSARSYQSLTGRFVPPDSAVYLEAANKTTKFWAIGAVDTESAAYNYGFSLIPTSTLSNDYYLGWAPGTTDLSANGSPVFVTPTVDNTIIYVDFNPLDGAADVTYTLNRIQVQKIFDPDRLNTGMHIWATDRIALVWGEDPDTADPGNPFIDAGYTILPTQSLLITPTPTPTDPGPSPTNTSTPTPTNSRPPLTSTPKFTPTSLSGLLIPITGFSPNIITDLDPGAQPVYSYTNILLEIPVLKISTSIVGVQQKAGTWDVSWLRDQAGWLEGSAFPTFSGNSIITAHVVTTYGKPGPFYHLKRLGVNENIYIFFGSYRYIYKVISNTLIKPDNMSVFAHADKPTLTLITCDSYDEKTETYLQRVAVRAILVDVLMMK